MTVRVVLLVVVVVIGLIVGEVGRRAASRRRPPTQDTDGPVLPAGLVLVTAPYCHRCGQLRDKINARRPDIALIEVDVTMRPDFVRAVDIRTAPTLLAVSATGHIEGRLDGNYTELELDGLLALA